MGRHTLIACAAMSEADDAKAYWSGTDFQQKEYARAPFYVTALTHVAKRLAPASVLEMGCNAGRNLKLLHDALPGARVRGFDINGASIAFGKEKWGLDLEVADEGYLARQPADSWDVMFTISVLDHIPEITGVLRDIARVTRRYYIAIEPFPEEQLAYLDVFKRDGRVRAAVTTETPYSYLHPYDRLVPPVGLAARLDLPMPPYAGNWGPLYRLTVYEKGQGGFTAWDTLREELIFDAVRAAR